MIIQPKASLGVQAITLDFASSQVYARSAYTMRMLCPQVALVNKALKIRPFVSDHTSSL
jgi:hypothetical protein